MMQPLHSDIHDAVFHAIFRQSSRDIFAFQAGVPGNMRGKVG
jgi:hypothetical protein